VDAAPFSPGGEGGRLGRWWGDGGDHGVLVIGAVLAGGLARRMGEEGKAGVLLAGRPLVSYPLEALGQVCDRVAVVCKRDTDLPELDGAERWDEPDDPRHPLAGIVHALERAEGPVLVCGADMPFVTADAFRTLLMGAGASGGARAVLATAAGRPQPVLAVYAPAALTDLRSAPVDAPLTDTVAALRPAKVALPPRMLTGVNTPEELAEAEAAFAQR
jgi:molybdopterin-guanine dinucleotide biosynthesis protein A